MSADEWLAIPGGQYEIGLREDEARGLAELAAKRAREQAAFDPDVLHSEREAKRLAETWGNPDYLYAQLAHSMPAHRVVLAPYAITRTPVTLSDWTRFRLATGAAPRATHAGDPAHERNLRPAVPSPDQPVTGVAWEEAKAFATWSQAELPREAEWEAALRPPSRSPSGTIGHELYEWCADEFGPYPGADPVAFGRIAAPPGGWWGTRVRRGGVIPGLPVTVVGRRGADPTQRLRDTTLRLVRR